MAPHPDRPRFLAWPAVFALARSDPLFMRIIVIAHNGYPFRNNEHAVLIATGITHHIVLLKD